MMPWVERAELLMALFVEPVSVDDSDGSVCDAIENLRPTYFGKGGDRTSDNIPEAALCESLGVEALYDLGGGKIQASQKLVNRRVDREWGSYDVLYDGAFKVKILTIKPGGKITDQRHEHRSEHWICPAEDSYQLIPCGVVHSLENETAVDMMVVEVQTGNFFEEDDIERGR